MAIDAQKLYGFAFDLIKVQIKKYSKLVSIGVGPDANMNAGLVRNQVADLLHHLKELLNNPKPSQQQLLQFAKRMKFYLDCEYIRGRAGWLLDENNVHNVEMDRLGKHFEALKKVCGDSKLDIENQDLSLQQKQCRHDSYEIAFFIIDLALRLVDDPQRTDISNTESFGHGFNIMKKHAQPEGRYHSSKIKEEMLSKYEKYKIILATSTFTKSTFQLNKENVKCYRTTDQHLFNQCWDVFLTKYPNSKLSKSGFKMFDVARTNPKPKATNQSWGVREYGIFAICAATTAVAVSVILAKTYDALAGNDTDTTSSPLSGLW